MSTAAPTQFRLSIGAKRQLTLPSELLEQLQVPERGELFVEIIGDHAVITPMVSLPRTELPEDLRRTFESRRGARPSDVPLAQFLEKVGYKAPAQKAAAPPRQSMQERLASLTPNEKKVLKKAGQKVLQQGPKREKRLIEQMLSGRSSELTAQTASQPETARKSRPSIAAKAAGLRAREEARSGRG